MNIFKSFGFKKVARTKEEVAKDPTMGIATDWGEIDREQEEDWSKYYNEQDRQDALDADVDPYGTGEYAENVKQDFLDAQARKPEPGEGVPVSGRKTIDEDPAEKSERMMMRQEHWDRGGKKGQTLADTRVGRSVSGTRPRQRDPMPYEGRGKDFGIGGAYRKPKSKSVLNMFKVFGLHKADKEDGHPDEDKKKTPNGHEPGDGDNGE